MPSKTQLALAIYDSQPEGQKNIARAAKEAGIKAPTLHNTINRRKEQLAAGREHCPCCGQVVRDGFKIDRSILKG